MKENSQKYPHRVLLHWHGPTKTCPMKLTPAGVTLGMFGFFTGIIMSVGVVAEALRKISIGVPILTALKDDVNGVSVYGFSTFGLLLSTGCFLYLGEVATEIINRLNSLPHDEK